MCMFMCVYMCILLYVYVYIYIYICVCICLCACMFMCVFICLCTCICIYIYTCVCVCMCICVCACMCMYIYMCVCVYVYVRVCIYIYIYVCVCVWRKYLSIKKLTIDCSCLPAQSHSPHFYFLFLSSQLPKQYPKLSHNQVLEHFSVFTQNCTLESLLNICLLILRAINQKFQNKTFTWLIK